MLLRAKACHWNINKLKKIGDYRITVPVAQHQQVN